MRVELLREDSTVREWLLTANIGKNTTKSYLWALQDYTEFTGKTPGDLIREAEEDIQKGLLLRQRRIKGELAGFRQSLQDAGKAPYTTKTKMTAIKNFFKSFDIDLPTLPHTGKARTLIENDRIPTKDDLREVLKVCDPLEKALLLVGASSGLAATEICNLKVGDFKKGYDPKTEITTLKLRRQKVGYDFCTFLTPEASRAVLEYLSYRDREPTDNRKSKQKVLNDDGFLFIVRQISEKYLKTKNENLRKFNPNALTRLYERLAVQAQKATPSGDWGFIRAHNMRKFFNSALLNEACGCDSFHVEFFMGHTLDATRSAYFRASPEKLKEIYSKCIPFLTIQKEGDITENPDFQRMNEEVARLKAENEKLRLDRHENEALKRFDEEIKELKRSQKERDAIRKEFEPFIKEYQEQVKRVEEVTGMDYEDALGLYNVDEIAPDSEEMKEHQKRLGKDKDYRQRYRTGMSGKLERQQQEIKDKLYKTLADEL